MADNKKIAKNTLFLYIRMLLIMGVSLYASRVVLDKLGVDDYSLYNVVGGVVGLLSFLTGTLSSGTSRFLTYELGANDKDRLKLTFNTAFFTHFLLAVLFIVILETLGLWYIYNKLVVPDERFYAALIVFQISVFASLISIMQIPYTSLIIAHEDMGVYAYVGIFDACARLGVVYLLAIAPFDKLIFYALLMALVQLIVTVCYWLYCHRHYLESRLKFVYDKTIFKSILGFSGWNVIAHLSETLKMQGYLVLLNLFFQPFVVAAQTIGNQVGGGLMQFIGNFRNAINPQIIKSYAAGDYEGSKQLTLTTTVLVFDLVLLLGLPTILVMNTIMRIWLVEVPQYTVIFTQFIVAQRILSVFDASFYVPMMAAAKIKTNSLISIITGPGVFVLLYFLYKWGWDVMWMQYIGLIVFALYGFIIKPILLVRDVKGYTYKDFIPCYFDCFKVAILSVALSVLFYHLVGNETIGASVLLFILSFVSVCLSSILFMESNMRAKLVQLCLSRFKKY